MIATKSSLKNTRQLLKFASRTFASGEKYAKFNYEDAFNLEASLTEEENMIWEVS